MARKRKTKMAKTKKMSRAKIGAGVGLAALAATAAGIYLLSGKKGAARRKKIAAWSVAARREVVERIRKAKQVNQRTYNEIVKKVSAEFGKLKKISPAEANKLATEMRGHWKNISKELQTVSKEVRRSARKVRRK